MNRNEIVEAHYRKHYKTLVNHMRNRVPNKSHHLAEEVVQEAYCRALKYFDGFNPEIKPFSTWFNRILNNSCSSCMQEEGGNSLSMDDDDQDLEPYRIMEDVSIPFDLVVLIQESMKKQKQDVYEVLNMFFNLGMKTREIAECVEYNHGNIRQIIRRFRIKFEDENSFRPV